MRRLIPFLLRRRMLYLIEALLSILYLVIKAATHSLSILSFILIGLGFFVLNHLLYRTQKRRVYRKHGRKIKKVVGMNIISKLLQVNICVALVFVDALLIKETTLGRLITGRGIVENTYSVIVLKDNEAHYIDDAKNYTFGYMRGYNELDVKNLASVIAKISVRNDQIIEPTVFETEKETYNALKTGEIKAMIINEDERNHYDDVASDFSDRTRVIKSYTIKTTSEVANKLNSADESYGQISIKA